MTKDKEVIQQWIDHVNENGVNLSKWELDFMESVTEFFSQRSWISDKQEDILERIYTDKTS